VIVRILLVIIGLIHLFGGLWMLADPMAWYGAVPGVALTGPANHHFISDIGLAFVASGAGLCCAAGSGLRNASLALAGSIWPVLHALLHVYGWFVRGAPSTPATAFTEIVGVVLIGALGFGLAWINARKEGVL